jgi:hypothetical protein
MRSTFGFASNAEGQRKHYEAKRAEVLADPDLGKRHDDVLAERHKVSRSFVAKTRFENGIEKEWRRAPTSARQKVIDSGLAGTNTDLHVAALLGVAKCTVQRVRKELGIKAYGGRSNQWGNPQNTNYGWKPTTAAEVAIEWANIRNAALLREVKWM